MIDHDMDIQMAINAPRLHQQWFPDEVLFEPYGVSPDTLNVLKGMGHKFAERPSFIASATGIMIANDGARIGAIDERSDGEAVGY
jgi:gamma-glutamyltranspeptidase / glutathione hydrolase